MFREWKRKYKKLNFCISDQEILFNHVATPHRSRDLLAQVCGKVTVRILEDGVLFGIQWFSRSNHAEIGHRHLFFVCRREESLVAQLFVQTLTNSRVRTVGTDEDVAVHMSVVREADHISFLVLHHGHDLLVETDL